MKKIVVLLAASLLLTGCFGFPFKTAISSNETGVIFSDGVTVTEVVGPGRYRDMRMHAKITQVDNSAKLYTWVGDDLWTKDKQPLDFIINVTYHRTTDPEIIKNVWAVYQEIFKRDESMERLVASRIPEAAKQMTVRDSLEGMLGIAEGSGGREAAQDYLASELAKELIEFGVVLDNVSIDTITASDEFVKKLQEKANAQLQVELAKQNTLMLEEELNQEKAQTNINIEIARRNNLVAEEQAKVFEKSAEYYEIRRLELLADIIGDNDKFIFVPNGADLTLLFGAEGITPLK